MLTAVPKRYDKDNSLHTFGYIVTLATIVTVVSTLPVIIGYYGYCISVVALVLFPPQTFEDLMTIRRKKTKNSDDHQSRTKHKI